MNDCASQTKCVCVFLFSFLCMFVCARSHDHPSPCLLPSHTCPQRRSRWLPCLPTPLVSCQSRTWRRTARTWRGGNWVSAVRRTKTHEYTHKRKQTCKNVGLQIHGCSWTWFKLVRTQLANTSRVTLRDIWTEHTGAHTHSHTQWRVPQCEQQTALLICQGSFNNKLLSRFITINQ